MRGNKVNGKDQKKPKKPNSSSEPFETCFKDNLGQKTGPPNHRKFCNMVNAAYIGTIVMLVAIFIPLRLS